MNTIKEKDELLLQGKYAEYLKRCTHQVRWLFKNSNKTTTVIPQKDVWAVVYKMEQRIRELEHGQNIFNVLNQNASARTNQNDICKCEKTWLVKGVPLCGVCGKYNGL